jgi:hypothetical protein
VPTRIVGTDERSHTGIVPCMAAPRTVRHGTGLGSEARALVGLSMRPRVPGRAGVFLQGSCRCVAPHTERLCSPQITPCGSRKPVTVDNAVGFEIESYSSYPERGSHCGALRSGVRGQEGEKISGESCGIDAWEPL